MLPRSITQDQWPLTVFIIFSMPNQLMNWNWKITMSLILLMFFTKCSFSFSEDTEKDQKSDSFEFLYSMKTTSISAALFRETHFSRSCLKNWDMIVLNTFGIRMSGLLGIKQLSEPKFFWTAAIICNTDPLWAAIIRKGVDNTFSYFHQHLIFRLSILRTLPHTNLFIPLENNRV